MTERYIAEETYFTADRYPKMFAGFTVPTAETTPWGEPGASVTLQLTVILGLNGSCEWERTVKHGTWSVESHGLRGSTQPKRGAGKPWSRGLGGFVGVSVENGGPLPSGGVLLRFHGKALECDSMRLENLVRGMATAHLDRIARTAQSAMLELGPVACDQEPEHDGRAPGPAFR